jgi:hypothetical protein
VSHRPKTTQQDRGQENRDSENPAKYFHESNCQELPRLARGAAARGVVGVTGPATADERDDGVMQAGTPGALVVPRLRVGVIGAADPRRLLCSIHG